MNQRKSVFRGAAILLVLFISISSMVGFAAIGCSGKNTSTPTVSELKEALWLDVSTRLVSRVNEANDADALAREFGKEHQEYARECGKAIGQWFDGLWGALKELGYISNEDYKVYDEIAYWAAATVKNLTGRDIRLFVH